MTRISAGHHTVEQIHSAPYALEDVAGCTHTHQVADLILGHVLFHHRNHTVHFFFGFAHGKAADGITIQIERCDLLHMADAQVVITASLIDAEQKLMRVYGEALAFQTRKFCFTALQPANRPIAGGFCILVFRGVFHAFVKRHGDCGTEVCLAP
jgi:hypothetical protein